MNAVFKGFPSIFDMECRGRGVVMGRVESRREGWDRG